MIASYHIQSVFHCTSQFNQEMIRYCQVELKKVTLQNSNVLIISQLMSHPLFHVSSLLLMTIIRRQFFIQLQ